MKFSGLCVLVLAAIAVSTQEVEAGQIPVVTVNDTDNGWSPFTYINIPGGSSNVPVLIDTGSSTIALCNTTDMGDIAQADGVYGCTAYGDGSTGWIGEFYNTPITLGDGKQIVTDPRNVSLALITGENTDICTPDIQGIMGIDAGTDYVYFEPQLLPSPGNCGHAENDTACCSTGNVSVIEAQFASSMLNKGDEYTFGFIGLSPFRNSSTSTESVLAFGATAREHVVKSVSAGTASFASNEQLWYTFGSNVTFSLTGFNPDIDNNCTTSFGNEQCSNSVSGVFIDSGTQPLVLPMNYLPDNFTSLVITVDDVELEFHYEDMMLLYDNGNLEFAGPDSATLGFPVFWFYDILFDVNIDKIATQGRYGDVTFYERSDVDYAAELDDDAAELEAEQGDNATAVEKAAESYQKQTDNVQEASPEMQDSMVLENMVGTASAAGSLATAAVSFFSLVTGLIYILW